MFSKSGSSSRWTYDVFLSFRGQDTRKDFTDHLHTALVQTGIHTFLDDELPRGQEISSQLCKAIQESRISIVVFSKGYASSRWCLNELVEILECKHRNDDQIVIPIFYDIDPSDVRKQTGSFAEAFDKYEECFKEQVNKWREVLLEAGNLSGWDLKNLANGHESKFIQMIVGHVSEKLGRKHLNVAKYPVGIDFRVDAIITRLNVSTNDVFVVGIYGMPGVGKTTIAKALFNRLCDGFEGSCFLFDVKEISKKSNNLVQLQEQLLCEILKPNVFKFYDEHRGINLIKERLCNKRILVVVDDVDHLGQLEALVGEKNWFGLGSVIIITTRDEHLLTQFEAFQVHLTGLDQQEALELFSWHAFRLAHPLEDYLELSYDVVKYCGGLPLALEVMGSFLFKRNKSSWESTMEKLRKSPHADIQERLKLSFDALDGDTQGVFLDISCLFINIDKEYVEKILHARYGFKPEITFATLIERSLLFIDRCNKLRMHDLIREMGREIVHEISPHHPGKRSRIWLYDDVLDVLNKQTGSETVQGLVLDVRDSEFVSFSTKSFTNMRYLQLLQINGVRLIGSYEHLSKELIWLCWFKCPLKYLPSNFQLDNMTILDMQHSYLTELWKDAKSLNKLKILNLSHSAYLVKLPCFLGFSSLERLILADCPSLREVPRCIGHLRRLVFFNLEGCCRLRILPESIRHLKSLEILNLNMCLQLEKLPDSFGDLESLTELLADETAITLLPSSIGNLKNLKSLSLSKCNCRSYLATASWLSNFLSWISPRSSTSKVLLPPSFFQLTSLTKLDLSSRGLSESEISNIDFRSLYSLEHLDLSANKFLNLPSGIGHLPKLELLIVNECTDLFSISEIPSTLGRLLARDCTSIQKVSFPSNARLTLQALGCKNLIEVQGIEGAANNCCFILAECNNLSDDFKKTLLQASGEDCEIVVVGGEIPEWFSYCGEGSSVSFQIPNPVSDGILQALLLWVVCTVNEKNYVNFPCFENIKLVKATVKDRTNGNRLFEKVTEFGFNRNYDKHSWVNHMTLTEFPCEMASGGELELCVTFGASSKIKVDRCGVHLIVRKADAAAAADVVNDESQSASTVTRCTNAWWESYLKRDLLQQCSEICSANGECCVSTYSARNGYFKSKGTDDHYRATDIDLY